MSIRDFKKIDSISEMAEKELVILQRIILDIEADRALSDKWASVTLYDFKSCFKICELLRTGFLKDAVLAYGMIMFVCPKSIDLLSHKMLKTLVEIIEEWKPDRIKEKWTRVSAIFPANTQRILHNNDDLPEGSIA